MYRVQRCPCDSLRRFLHRSYPYSRAYSAVLHSFLVIQSPAAIFLSLGAILSKHRADSTIRLETLAGLGPWLSIQSFHFPTSCVQTCFLVLLNRPQHGLPLPYVVIVIRLYEVLFFLDLLDQSLACGSEEHPGQFLVHVHYQALCSSIENCRVAQL